MTDRNTTPDREPDHEIPVFITKKQKFDSLPPVTKRGQPRYKSLEIRLYEFFEENPTEELSYADIVTKFDVSLRAAYGAVERCKAVEVLKVIRKRGV
jgi:hypothetical protein